jgi:hypothetical protein
VAKLVSLTFGFIFVMVIFVVLVVFGGILPSFVISVVFSAMLRIPRVAFWLAFILAAVLAVALLAVLGLPWLLLRRCSRTRSGVGLFLDGTFLGCRCSASLWWLRPAELRQLGARARKCRHRLSVWSLLDRLAFAGLATKLFRKVRCWNPLKTVPGSGFEKTLKIYEKTIGKSMVFDGLKQLKSIEKLTLFLTLGHSKKQ